MGAGQLGNHQLGVPAVSVLTLEEAALAAASAAAEATAELIRYAREGAYHSSIPFNDDVVHKLADSLKLALEIDTPSAMLDDGERAAWANLQTAVATFVEGWAG
jgi:hypothetical protein